MTPLAIDWLPWVGALCAIFVVVFAVVLLSPSKRREDAIDPEVEARLLLGEDPDEIDRDLAEQATSTTTDEVTVTEPTAEAPAADEAPA